MHDLISASTSGEHVILGLCFDEEGGFDWIEGEREFAPLLPLRQQILDGDYRALYLAWLRASQFTDPDEEERVEPPVPPGLRALSKPLKTFVKFFGMDDDLLAVAAEGSSDVLPGMDLEPWLPRLADDERLEFLRRLLRGEPSVSAELRRRVKELVRQQRPAAPSEQSTPRRRVSDLLEAAETVTRERAERAKRAQEAERLRKLDVRRLPA